MLRSRGVNPVFSAIPHRGGVGLERGGTLGQHAVQVRNAPPGFLNPVQNPSRSRRRGRRVVKPETVDHFSSPNDVAVTNLRIRRRRGRSEEHTSELQSLAYLV